MPHVQTKTTSPDVTKYMIYALPIFIDSGYLDKDDLKVAVTALLGFRPSKVGAVKSLSKCAVEIMLSTAT